MLGRSKPQKKSKCWCQQHTLLSSRKPLRVYNHFVVGAQAAHRENPHSQCFISRGHAMNIVDAPPRLSPGSPVSRNLPVHVLPFYEASLCPNAALRCTHRRKVRLLEGCRSAPSLCARRRRGGRRHTSTTMTLPMISATGLIAARISHFKAFCVVCIWRFLASGR